MPVKAFRLIAHYREAVSLCNGPDTYWGDSVEMVSLLDSILTAAESRGGPATLLRIELRAFTEDELADRLANTATA